VVPDVGTARSCERGFAIVHYSDILWPTTDVRATSAALHIIVCAVLGAGACQLVVRDAACLAAPDHVGELLLLLLLLVLLQVHHAHWGGLHSGLLADSGGSARLEALTRAIEVCAWTTPRMLALPTLLTGR